MAPITACNRDCMDACSLVVDRREDGRLKINGNPAHPHTAGFNCAKIKKLSQRLTSPSRITQPLLRRGDGRQPIAWDEALDLAAGQIDALRADPQRMLHVYGYGHKGVLVKKVERFFSELGASRLTGALCDGAGGAAYELDFGDLGHNEMSQLLRARTIVNWGRDSARSSIHTVRLIARARKQGTRLVVISPGGEDESDFGDVRLAIEPGTDRFLAAAVIRRLIEADRIPARLTDRALGWPRFKELILARPLDDLLAACGVDRAGLDVLVEAYQTGPCASLMGWAIQRYALGGQNVRFINALAFLSGQIGCPGGGSYFGLSSSRNFNFGWAKAAGDSQRRELLMPLIGRDVANADPPIELIWVNGTNIVNQAPDSRAVARAFERAKFTVVVDAFLTDTAALADLILPAKIMPEKEDLVGSVSHHYVNYSRPVADPPPLARDDTWIVDQIANRLSPPISLPPDEDCLAMSLDSPWLKTSLAEMRAQGFALAERPPIVFPDLKFAHDDGLYHLPESLDDQPPAPEGFPLRLLSLVRRGAIHSQILPEEHPARPTVYLAPDSPGWAMFDSDRPVFLVSELGRLEVEVAAKKGLRPGVVVYRRGDWLGLGGGVNQLIQARLSDIGETAAYYDQFVRLEN